MATSMYAEEELYPVGEDGNADKSKVSSIFEIQVSNFHGSHQIYLKVTDESGDEKWFYLKKKQAESLANGFNGVLSYLGYGD